MEGRFGDRRGGIGGLCRLLTEYGEAIEYDLIALGLRIDWLGTTALSWRDLMVVVRCSRRGSALSRAVNGELDEWGLLEHLAAGQFDLAAIANWQRAGDDKAKRPDPLPRPGAKKHVEGETLAHGKPVTTDQMDRMLGWTKE